MNSNIKLEKSFRSKATVITKPIKMVHGIVVRAFVLYWGGNKFESLSTHHCWALSKSFIPSLLVSERAPT